MSTRLNSPFVLTNSDSAIAEIACSNAIAVATAKRFSVNRHLLLSLLVRFSVIAHIAEELEEYPFFSNVRYLKGCFHNRVVGSIHIEFLASINLH